MSNLIDLIIHITVENRRQDVINSVENKFSRLSLPANNPSHSQVHMFNVEQMGAGGSAIAAAASQAIAATQQVFETLIS